MNYILTERLCKKCGIVKPVNELIKGKNSKYGYQSLCKECKSKYRKEDYIKNKEHNLKRMKEYNKEHYKEIKQYRKEHSKEIKEYLKEYYIKNKEKTTKQQKENYKELTEKLCKKCGIIKSVNELIKNKNCKNGYESTCKKCQSKYNKKWRDKNREHILICKKKYQKKYYKKNKERILFYIKKYHKTTESKEYQKNYVKNRRHKDPIYKLIWNLRNRLNSVFKNKCQKSKKTLELLGCSLYIAKFYLENQFYDNPETGELMTWDNNTTKGWHIDHIIPICNFDLTDTEQQKKAFHISNLQPLWAKENLTKSKYIL